MQRFKVVVFIALVGVIFGAGDALTGQPNVDLLFQNAKNQYTAIFNSPRKLADRAEWESVVSRFRLVIKTSPSSPRASESMYTVGLIYKNLYRRSGAPADKAEALGSFNQLLDRYPKSPLTSSARRHIGDIQFIGKDYANASRSYRNAAPRRDKKKNIKTVSIAPYTKTAFAPSPVPAKTDDDGEIATLLGVRQYSANGHTRLVLDLSGQTAYDVDSVEKNRMSVSLMGVKPASSVSRSMEFDKGLARRVRLENAGNGVIKVVIEFTSPDVDSSVMVIKNPFRVVIDLGSASAPAPTPSAQARVPSKPPVREGSESKPVIPDTGRIRTIVIDPGHGGKDPGAIGPTGLMEKDVALDIAKRLKAKLESRMDCKVLLTRTTDRFLELDERTMFANSVNADLFVSVHLNASRDRKARGVETYFLSPARSKEELATAARENMMALGSQDEIENDLAYIMSDLTSTQKVNDSATLAGSVQSSMTGGMRRASQPVKDKGVKQAMFYVLWRASMPSVLVETGFISNREDERSFKNSGYLDSVAESIAGGLASYGRAYMVASAK
ncbi:MAG: N-acetylmuramoyl-L-alanine amidase [Nitrospinae bacterium]|nr:N-acetylmuramoyl-L-alanine amidase [Nitrospinota bacterium]MBF0634758.1 N-acetylmuramoyl-L-alanine amidase [Nitrospinota bacterium]